MAKSKKCRYCTEPSLRGLISGKELCEFHFYERIYGTAWAQHVRETRIQQQQAKEPEPWSTSTKPSASE